MKMREMKIKEAFFKDCINKEKPLLTFVSPEDLMNVRTSNAVGKDESFRING